MSSESPGLIELVTDDAASMVESSVQLAESLGVPTTGMAARLWRARSHAAHGSFLRAEMPVIEESDIPNLKSFMLSDGVLLEEDTVRPKDLVPLQKQIYVDKVIRAIASHGVNAERAFVSSKHIVTTSDRHIVDGHHRWLTGMLLDPDKPTPAVCATGTASEVLSDFIAFSDAEGHERNE